MYSPKNSNGFNPLSLYQRNVSLIQRNYFLSECPLIIGIEFAYWHIPTLHYLLIKNSSSFYKYFEIIFPIHVNKEIYN